MRPPLPQPELPLGWSQSPAASPKPDWREAGPKAVWTLIHVGHYPFSSSGLACRWSHEGLCGRFITHSWFCHTKVSLSQQNLMNDPPTHAPCPSAQSASSHSREALPHKWPQLRNSRCILQVFLHICMACSFHPLCLKIWPITIPSEHETVCGPRCSPSEVSPFGVEENNLLATKDWTVIQGNG